MDSARTTMNSIDGIEVNVLVDEDGDDGFKDVDDDIDEDDEIDDDDDTVDDEEEDDDDVVEEEDVIRGVVDDETEVGSSLQAPGYKNFNVI